jgi:hypothetical protein
MVTSQVYGSFSKWYLAKLKAAPLLTNLSTGVVLLTGSDVLVQKVESRQSPAVTLNDDDNDDCCCCDSVETIVAQHRLDIENDILGATFEDEIMMYATDVLVRGRLLDRHESLVESLKDEWAFWNPFRTGTMATWAFLYVPFYATVYQAFDRYLPKRTPGGVFARVALSFVTSLPVNAAFYTYGTAIQHTQTWYIKQQQNRQRHQETDVMTSVPYRLDELWNKTLWKLQNEFPTTIQLSATCWVPVNFFLFSVVPSHLQPLSLMVCSFFWNCYLSVSQHRSSLAAAAHVGEPK